MERGQKEASSELLASICSALEVPLSTMLSQVAERIATAEGLQVPDTVPTEFQREFAGGVVPDRVPDALTREELARSGS